MTCRVAVVVVAGFVGLVAGACGDDDGGDADRPAPSTAAAPAPSTTIEEMVTSTLDGLGDDAEVTVEVTTAVTRADTPVSSAAAPDTTAAAPTPSSDSGDEPEGDVVLPDGFAAVTVTVTAADGDVTEYCVWLAETMAEQQRGLMEVTDLGDAAGMLFAYDDEVTHSFWMANTPMPLSIAFFGGDGRFVSDADMEPCLRTFTAECARYSADGPYRYALEAPRGELDALGIGAGARLEVELDTRADVCPADT